MLLMRGDTLGLGGAKYSVRMTTKKQEEESKNSQACQPGRSGLVLPSNRSEFEVNSIRFENHTTSGQFEVSKWVEVDSWLPSKIARNGRFLHVRRSISVASSVASPAYLFLLPLSLLSTKIILVISYYVCSWTIGIIFWIVFSKYLVKKIFLPEEKPSVLTPSFSKLYKCASFCTKIIGLVLWTTSLHVKKTTPSLVKC